MKTLSLISLCIIFILSFNNANAKIRRVGYPGIAITGTDYTNIQAAHDAASAGDTLLIYPGNYGGSNIGKRLVFIGYGYFLYGSGADSGYQVITGSLSFSLNLYSGSDSTVMKGLDGITVYDEVGNYVIVDRCNCTINFGGLGTVHLGWRITNSFVSIGYVAQNGPFQTQKLDVENCYIYNLNFATFSNTSAFFKNNIFSNNFNFNNAACTFINNIFLSTAGPTNITNSVFSHNILPNSGIPSGNGNKLNTDISTVFVGYPTQGTYSNDGRYKLASGSPALNAGENGDDCGIFGGANPYHLGGIPPIPSFYKLTAPSGTATSNPYTITFSVKGNN